MNGVMCLAQGYEFEGVQFEIARWGEPIRLRKDGEPYKRQSNAFFDLYDRFCALSDEEKQVCKICGGCYSFGIGEE